MKFSFPAKAIYSAPSTLIVCPQVRASTTATATDTITPNKIGTILLMPLPQMLKTTTTTRAISAKSQFVLQLETALPARIKPIAIIIGPVTTGGKKRITFSTGKMAKSAARIK